MRNCIVIALCVLGNFGFLAGQEDLAHYQEFSQAGNTLYEEGQYQEALEQYMGILEAGYISPEVYFNVANCHYQLGAIPSSILFFERAALLAPSDKDIAFNLEIANAATLDQIEALPRLFLLDWLDGFAQMLSVDGWGYLSLVLVFLVTGFLLIFQLSSKVGLRKTLFFSAIVCFVIAFVAFGTAWTQLKTGENNRSAIVFEATVSALNEPSHQANDQFILHEGTKVKILEEREDWFKISIASGDVGWVPSSVVVSI